VPHVKTSGAACLVEVKPVKRSGRSGRNPPRGV